MCDPYTHCAHSDIYKHLFSHITPYNEDTRKEENILPSFATLVFSLSILNYLIKMNNKVKLKHLIQSHTTKSDLTLYNKNTSFHTFFLVQCFRFLNNTHV